jgi:cellulose synthase/poly-beta-1,6-N-acetylglucosamine synthase-like glycosyltransferase
MLLVEIFFFSSLFILFYVYAGYPLFILLLAKIRPQAVCKAVFEPTVTLIIPAYNEERHIRDTIENKLSLDYPVDKLEILVVSDGSTDHTDSIVSEYADKGVRLLRQEPRAGKTSGLNKAIMEARGEIVFFSDANSIHDQKVLRALVANFSDPQVGYVTGKMVYANPDGSTIGDGCSAYMKYENFLRECETRTGSVVGVDGGVDAVRRHLYLPMNADQLPDFVLPLAVFDQGYRVVYEPDALLYEDALNKVADEYRMRVRVSLRALWALYDMRRLLSPRKNFGYAWQLWSHKVLRYLCFVFLFGAYLSNIVLVEQGKFYILMLFLQTMFYCSAILSPSFERMGKRNRLFFLAYYYCIINLAAGHAFVNFMLGKKMIIWNPRKG